MGFYTKNYLLSKGKMTLSKRMFFSESVNESRKSNSFDIFLSHSHEDKEYIQGLYNELTELGYSVYVDWIIDPELKPSLVTKRTVEALRNRMNQCKSLIYATSENASTSKWMPWELGYMDGKKGRCSILPITEYETSVFEGQEFLSIYPYITKDGFKSNPSNKVLWVNESNDTYVTMKDWQNGKSPFYHNH